MGRGWASNFIASNYMRKLLLFALLFCPALSAAISGNTVWEVRFGGSDTNGGGFSVVSSTAKMGVAIPLVGAWSATCTNTAGGFASQTNVFVTITYTDGWGATAIGDVKQVTNCTNSSTNNKLVVTAPTSVPGCQSGTTCKWSAYFCGTTAQTVCTAGGPFWPGASGTGLTLSSNYTATAVPTSGTMASGVDYSQQASAQIAVTDAGTTSSSGTVTSTTCTNLSAGCAGGMSGLEVGNICYVQGGTGPVTAIWVQITAVATASTGSMTVTPVIPTTSTGVTLNCGGALASIGRAAGSKVAQNWIYVQYDGSNTYLMTSTSTNVAAGAVADASNNSTPATMNFYIGYQTNRVPMNSDTRPTIQASGAFATATMFALSGSAFNVQNLIFDGNGKTATLCVGSTGSAVNIYRVKIMGCTNSGVSFTSSGQNPSITYSEVTGVTAGTAAINMAGTSSSGSVMYNEVHGNSVTGIVLNTANDGACLAIGNLVYGNGTSCSNNICTAANADGIVSSGLAANVIGNTVYGNGRYGISISGSGQYGNLVANNILESNTNVGIQTSGITGGVILENNACYSNNSTTALRGCYNPALFISVGNVVNNTTGTFFVSPSTANFALNYLPNQGLLLLQAGFPATSAAGTTLNFLDIGPAQSARPTVVH